MPNLIVYNPDPPVLVAWCNRLRTEALKARRDVARRKDMIHTISSQITSHHEHKLHRIVEVRNRIRLLRRGIPTTEALEPVNSSSQLDDNLSDADRVVLKKAYRKAVATAHPDKGGTVEDFHAVHEAYLAGDLSSLTEYFLLQEGTLYQKIDYWLQQPLSTQVDWMRFQATNEYKIVVLHQRGERERAIKLAGHILDIALELAEQEEMDMLLNMSGFHRVGGTTVNNSYGGSV